MRRARSAASAAAVVLLAAGCGEDSAQHAARLAVQGHAGGATTHCTESARRYFQLVPTRVYVCIVERAGSSCDEYLALRHGRRFEVRLRRRGVDCLLPTG